MNFGEVFGEAKQFYDQLSPQQRQTVVQQFQQHFGNSGDPQLQQQAQALDPNNPDPQQLGQMHDYAQQAAPDALNRVMDHPELQQAMSQQGITDWQGGQSQNPSYQNEPYQAQQGGYQQDQGGYQGQGGFGSEESGSGYGQPGYGDQGGYQQDQGGFGNRDGHQQDTVNDQDPYQQGDYPEGGPGRDEGYQQNGQEDPYQQDRGGY